MPRLKLASVALCIGMLLSGAQTPPNAGPAQGGPSALTLAGDHADVPLVDLPGVRSGQPKIEVMLNGQGPFRLAVDTGFPNGQLALSPGVVSALKLDPIGTINATDGGGKTVPVRLYQLDSVKFGGLDFAGARAGEIRIPGANVPFDGVIGMGLFRDLLLSIDYKNRRLTASPGSLPEPDGKTIVKYGKGPGGLIEIPLKIGSSDVSAILDTGNGSRPLSLPEKMVADLPVSGEARDEGMIRTVSQQIHTKAAALGAPVMFGPVILPVPEVSYPSASHPNLGSLALRGMTVTVDQKNGRVRITPTP